MGGILTCADVSWTDTFILTAVGLVAEEMHDAHASSGLSNEDTASFDTACIIAITNI